MAHTQPIADRRPLASRSWPVMGRIASVLVANRVSPNLISVLGMLVAILAGVLLVLTGDAGWRDRVFYALAAGCIQLRLLSNLLDGMVAIEGSTKSAVGELYNDVPDRISDSAILLGAGYAVGSSPELGWAATALALFVTYIRVLGKSCGAGADYRGPMAKPHRMALLTIACLWLAFAPSSWAFTVPSVLGSQRLGPMGLALAVICVGCVVTAVRRLARTASRLKAGSISA